MNTFKELFNKNLLNEENTDENKIKNFKIGDVVDLTDKKVKNSLKILYKEEIKYGKIISIDNNQTEYYPIKVQWTKKGGTSRHKNFELIKI